MRQFVMAPRKKKRKRKRKTSGKKPQRNFFPQELLDRLRKRMEKEQGKSDLSLAPTTEATTADPSR
ncbi:MAG: hypothetical protein V3S55_12375 [Nitrospiraceae bacterium]